MVTQSEDFLAHIGIVRRSGRYPWGSGENPYQRGSKAFLDQVSDLKKQGLSEAEIAKGLGITTTELRAAKAIAKNAKKKAEIAEAMGLKEQGILTSPSVKPWDLMSLLFAPFWILLLRSAMTF